MKEIRNFRNIRRKPQLFGFTYNNFLIFCAIALLGSFILFNGITFKKIIIYAIILLIGFIATRYLIGAESLLNKAMNEKFPKEINDFTKKVKKKK
jgi:hypothetical protein